MKISEISSTWIDFPTEEDLAVIVYFVGCSHNCTGCQNKEFQDYMWKEKETTVKDAFKEITEYAKRSKTNKIVFSGGDPLFVKNIDGVIALSKLLQENNYSVCIYTGYTIDFIKTKDLKHVDYFKCGKYVESLKEKEWGKNESGFKLVSKNQKIYNHFNLISENNFLKWDKNN